jgi:hypothetical protein
MSRLSKRLLNFKLHLGFRCGMLQMVRLMMSRSLGPDALADVMNQVLNCESRLVWLLVDDESSYAFVPSKLIPTCKLAGSHTASSN